MGRSPASSFQCWVTVLRPGLAAVPGTGWRVGAPWPLEADGFGVGLWGCGGGHGQTLIISSSGANSRRRRGRMHGAIIRAGGGKSGGLVGVLVGVLWCGSEAVAMSLFVVAAVVKRHHPRFCSRGGPARFANEREVGVCGPGNCRVVCVSIVDGRSVVRHLECKRGVDGSSLLMAFGPRNWRGLGGPCGRLGVNEAEFENLQDNQVGRRGGDSAAGGRVDRERVAPLDVASRGRPVAHGEPRNGGAYEVPRLARISPHQEALGQNCGGHALSRGLDMAVVWR